MKRFPKKCRQRKKSGGDLLFICLRDESGKWRHEFFGRWDDKRSHDEYDRRKLLFEESGEISDALEEGITIFTLADQFLSWARGYYKKNGNPTDEPKNLFNSIRHVVEYFGSEKVSEFNLKKLRFIQSELDKSGRLCRKQVNRRINHIRRMFRFGAENESVPIDVITSLSLLRPLKIGRCQSIDHPPVSSVSMEIVDATLRHLSSVVGDMIRIQLLTGCRPEEVRIMRPCDFERLDGEWIYRPSHDKTEHLRRPGDKKEIHLGLQAISIILEHTIGISDTSDEYVFRPVDAVMEKRRKARNARKTKITPSQRLREKNSAGEKKSVYRDLYSSNAYRIAI